MATSATWPFAGIGVSLSLPQVEGHVHQEGNVLSPDGHCRAFDQRARGTVNGSGAGVVVLKRLDDALADGDVVHAVIKGTAVNNDGARKVGYSAPSVAGQAQVIAQALAMARLAARDITYVEAHGTGTTLGDPIEMAALKRAFAAAGPGAAGSCAVGSVKTNLGHLNTAAGLAGLIKTVLMLRHRSLVPSLHFKRLNPAIDLADSPFYVNAELRPWPAGEGPRRAGVSSFSIGGTNAHVILEEAPSAVPGAPGASGVSGDDALQLLVLSAKTPRALSEAAERLAARLGRTPKPALADVAFTLQTGRKALPYRRALVGRTATEIAPALLSGCPARPDRRRPPTREATGRWPSCFRARGRSTPGRMERRLSIAASRSSAARSTSARRSWRRGSAAICGGCCFPRRTRRRRRMPRASWPGPRSPSPPCSSTSTPWPRLWMGWGVHPEVMLGHSVGELVAACLAGVFSLADALTLVAERGRLMQALPPGRMLAVAASEEDLAPRLGGALDLAAVNGPAACVVAGTAEAVAALEERLVREGTAVRRLPVTRAFHSRQVEPAMAPFARQVAAVRRHPPRLPWISNVTGERIGDQEATDPEYWARQLRRTVRFSAGLAALLAEPSRVLLEVGPGDTLTRLAGRHPAYDAGHGAGRVSAASSSREPRDEERSLLEALGRLWTAGVTVDWPSSMPHRHTPARGASHLPLLSGGVFWDRRRHRAPPFPPHPPRPGRSRRRTAATDARVRTSRPPTSRPPTPSRRRSPTACRSSWASSGSGAMTTSSPSAATPLLAVQLINRLRGHFQIDLPLSALFEAPTVSALAARIAEGRVDLPGDAGEIEALLREIQTLSPDELSEAIAEETALPAAAVRTRSAVAAPLPGPLPQDRRGPRD